MPNKRNTLIIMANTTLHEAQDEVSDQDIPDDEGHGDKIGLTSSVDRWDALGSRVL